MGLQAQDYISTKNSWMTCANPIFKTAVWSFSLWMTLSKSSKWSLTSLPLIVFGSIWRSASRSPWKVGGITRKLTISWTDSRLCALFTICSVRIVFASRTKSFGSRSTSLLSHTEPHWLGDNRKRSENMLNSRGILSSNLQLKSLMK